MSEDTLSAEDIAEMRAAHVPSRHEPDAPDGWCDVDDFRWPCDTALVLRALAAERDTSVSVPVDWPTLANVIREVDGNHDLGAGELAERILSHPKVAALRATTEAPEPGLDVERLRRAMDVVVPESIPPLYWTNERLARAIAAEYARASTPTSTPEPGS